MRAGAPPARSRSARSRSSGAHRPDEHVDRGRERAASATRPPSRSEIVGVAIEPAELRRHRISDGSRECTRAQVIASDPAVHDEERVPRRFADRSRSSRVRADRAPAMVLAATITTRSLVHAAWAGVADTVPASTTSTPRVEAQSRSRTAAWRLHAPSVTPAGAAEEERHSRRMAVSDQLDVARLELVDHRHEIVDGAIRRHPPGPGQVAHEVEQSGGLAGVGEGKRDGAGDQARADATGGTDDGNHLPGPRRSISFVCASASLRRLHERIPNLAVADDHEVRHGVGPVGRGSRRTPPARSSAAVSRSASRSPTRKRIAPPSPADPSTPDAVVWAITSASDDDDLRGGHGTLCVRGDDIHPCARNEHRGGGACRGDRHREAALAGGERRGREPRRSAQRGLGHRLARRDRHGHRTPSDLVERPHHPWKQRVDGNGSERQNHFRIVEAPAHRDGLRRHDHRHGWRVDSRGPHREQPGGNGEDTRGHEPCAGAPPEPSGDHRPSSSLPTPSGLPQRAQRAPTSPPAGHHGHGCHADDAHRRSAPDRNGRPTSPERQLGSAGAQHSTSSARPPAVAPDSSAWLAMLTLSAARSRRSGRRRSSSPRSAAKSRRQRPPGSAEGSRASTTAGLGTAARVSSTVSGSSGAHILRCRYQGGGGGGRRRRGSAGGRRAAPRRPARR